MEQIKYYIEKYKVTLILAFIILGLLISLIFYITNKKEEKVEEVTKTIVDTEIDKEEEEIIENIKVDIKGMVENPGVYELSNNDRVIDVIEIAGGLKEGANTEYINLSKKLVDEMIIIIYSNDEVEKFKETEPEKEIIYIEHECVCPDNINDSCITETDTVNTNGVKEESNKDIEKEETEVETESNVSNNLVSINTATLEELMTLSGIGESKAKAIIAYREENDGFKTLEELMNVSGIGEKAYSKIKDYIKL
ncbi:MAG: helix-hairpin-helix domain-containing protein [Bacilli bacterium]|nr:helix-hairpin-helix domain-containing protein [Bacilli bacterium]